MITVYYGEYDCSHFTKEILKAEQDIENHKLVAEILRLTGSEHYILRLLQAVRNGELLTDELQLFCKDVKIDSSVELMDIVFEGMLGNRDPKAAEKLKEEREKVMKKREDDSRKRKERGCLLRAKLITIKGNMEAKDILGSL